MNLYAAIYCTTTEKLSSVSMMALRTACSRLALHACGVELLGVARMLRHFFPDAKLQLPIALESFALVAI